VCLPHITDYETEDDSTTTTGSPSLMIVAIKGLVFCVHTWLAALQYIFFSSLVLLPQSSNTPTHLFIWTTVIKVQLYTFTRSQKLVTANGTTECVNLHSNLELQDGGL